MSEAISQSELFHSRDLSRNSRIKGMDSASSLVVMFNKIKKCALGLSVITLLFSNHLFGINDHLFSKSSELTQNRNARIEATTPSLTEILSQTDLNEAVEVIQETDGKYFIRTKNSSEGEKARAKIRSSLEGIDVLHLLETHFEESIELSVYNKARNLILKQEVPLLGAAILAALTMPSRDNFPGGRRLFLKDKNKLFTSLSLMTKETESLDNLRINLRTANEWSNRLDLRFTFLNNQKPSEPPQQFFSWNENEKRYELVPNDKTRALWEGKEEASRVIDNPIFAKELKTLKAHNASKPVAETAQEFLSREEIATQVYSGSGNEKRVGELVKKAVIRFLQRTDDPNQPGSFTVSKRPLGYHEPVVSAASQDVERIAFVYPDGNSALRKTTARSSGISKIYDISHPSQAIPFIKNAFQTTGKPLEICFCSHGSPGSLVMASPNSSEIDLLTRETKGMVCGAYALGCSVGAQAENTSRPHLLRELSVGWGVPVSGVDQTLYLDNQKWYLQGGGQVVTVYPVNQEVRSTSLIDQTPVWLEQIHDNQI